MTEPNAPTATSPSRRFRVGVGLVALLGLVVRLWSVASATRTDPTGGDGFYYHEQANMLARGMWFADPYRMLGGGPFVPGNAHPPLFTLWLAISSFLGGTSFRAHKTMACLAGVLLIVGVALLARELAGRRAGIIAATLAALYPSFWLIGGLLMSEELYAALLAWFLYLIYRWCRQPSILRAGLIGILLALAVLTRAEAVMYAPLLVLPVMALPGRLTLAWRRRVLHVAVAGSACALVLAPWVIRSAVTFNQFEPFSTNGDELFVYANNPIAYGTSNTPLVCTNTYFTIGGERKGITIEPQGTTYLGLWYFPWEEYLRCQYGEPKGDPSDKALYWREQGVTYMREHRGRLPVVMAARIGRVWEVYRPFQNAAIGRVEGRPERISQVGLFYFWGLVLLSAAGLRSLRKRKVRIWPLVSMAVGVTLTVMYAYGNERFRLPLDVALCVAAGVAIDALLRRRWPVVTSSDGPQTNFADASAGDGRIVECPGPSPAELGRTVKSWLWGLPWRTIAMWAVIALVFAVPFRGLMHSPGGPMEEGFMLTFPERILHGDLPNRAFLHLYGPGSLWVLSALYWLFGTSLGTERLFGALQVIGVAAGLTWLVRPFGRVVAASAGVVCLLVLLPALGFTALAWNGGVALLVLGVCVARLGIGASVESPLGVGALRRLGAGGVLAGFALLYRPDLALALALVGTGLLWRAPREAVRRAIGGVLLGVSPILVHLATAGPGHVINGMFIDPVFRLRGGRTLPIPPSPHELQVYVQRLAAYTKMPWPFPHFPIAGEVAAWFWLVPLSAAFVFGAALRARRVAPGAATSQALWLGALFTIGILPQAFQRADAPHFAWVSSVSLALVPAAVASLLTRRASLGTGRPAGWRAGAGLATAAVLLLCVIPLQTVRVYTQLAERSAGRQVAGWPISRHGRSFPYGSPAAAEAGNALVADLDRLAHPGQRLFVGPQDLRKTPYSQAFWYFLYPDLVPATYYIEMDPWLANKPGSRLANDVASADWLILTSMGAGWDEPNLSRRVGSDAPNEVVRREFCLVHTYGGRPDGGPDAAIWSLYGRCSLLGRAPGS